MDWTGEELEYVEDSEPERWSQPAPSSRPPRSLSASQVVQQQEQETEEITIPESPPVPSTSHHFAQQHGSPTKRRRTSDGEPSRRVSPPSLSRKISLSSFSLPLSIASTSTSTSIGAVKPELEPKEEDLALSFPPAAQPHHSRTTSTSTSTSSSKRKSDPTLEKEKKPKKRHSSSSSTATTGIMSASALLRASAGMEREGEVKPRKSSSKSKEKGKSKSKGKGKEKESMRLSISSTESAESESLEVEVIPRLKSKSKSKSRVKVKEEVEEEQDELEDDDVVVPPRLDGTIFSRALYGLPPLAPKANVKPSKLKEKEKKGKQKRASSDEEEGSDAEEGEELTAADKLRGRLGGFKYLAGSHSASGSNSGEERSRSLSRSLSLDDDSKPTASVTHPKPPKKKERSPSPPPPLVLPAEERLKPLLACPLCQHAWTATKTAVAKGTHLRKCGRGLDYTSETVRILIENALLGMAREVEVQQRDQSALRTVFDRAVGVGEGANQLREVRVVGVEGGHPALEGEGDAMVRVQKELDGKRKRRGVERVVKVAREIRGERREREERERVKRGGARVKEEEEGEMQGPRATGLLRPMSTGARRETWERAGEVLEGMGGTGLTQLPSAGQGSSATTTTTRKPTALDLSLSSDIPPAASFFAPPPHLASTTVVEEDQDEIEIISPSFLSGFSPPRTQPFAQSALAGRYASTGQVEVVAIPAPVKRKGKRKSEESAEEGREGVGEGEGKVVGGSLWQAAGGRDDETIRRVVFSSPPPPSSPSPSPPTAPHPRHTTLSPTLRLSSPTLAGSPSPSLSPDRARALTIDLDSSLDLDLPPDIAADLSLIFDDDSLNAPLGDLTRSPPPHPPSREEPLLEEGMRTLGLRGLDALHQIRVEEEGEVWVDEEEEEGGEGMLVWEGGAMEQWREEEGVISSSSDEEPLVEVVARRLSIGGSLSASGKEKAARGGGESPAVSPTKCKAKAKVTAARRVSPHSITSPSASEDDDDDNHPPPRPPNMPDYSSLPIADLQKQVQKFGFRSSKERSVLVDQLEKVWLATHPQPKVVKVKPKGKKAARKKKEVAVEEQEEDEVVESLGVKLRALVVGSEEMYLKVLRYEPILFDDLVTLAATNKIKCAKPLLMRFLDEQSVTYYIEDPTNGSRRRHK